MDVLVTGGAGFIGSHLVSLLVGRDAAVRVLERPDAPVDHLPLDRIDLVFADVRDRAAVAKAVRGCPFVYHLAGNPNLWTHRRGHFAQVNYRGTVHVLDAALEAGARRVLHTSTESILTRTHQRGAIREDQRVASTTPSAPTAARSSWPSSTPSAWPEPGRRSSSSTRPSPSAPVTAAARRRRR